LILPTEREAEKITGLQAGGISPLALINRGFEIIIDDSVNRHSEIHISGGQRGVNIRLPVINLIEILRAKVLRVCS
jgi:Cys-tRNA(Pro)/Cys-tRNA(Cys) deacylase